MIDLEDSRSKALLKARAEFQAEAQLQAALGNKELFDQAVLNAIRTGDELLSTQRAYNNEREAALFELGDNLVALESATGDKLAVELQVYLDDLATLEGEAYTDRLAETEAFAAEKLEIFRRNNIDISRILRESQSGLAGGGDRRLGRSRSSGSGPNFEGRVDPDSVTLGADGRYRDENGNVVEGNTARPNDDGTFTTEGGQTIHTDDSGNAYFNEGLTQPVSDELQDNIDSQNAPGLHRGGIVMPRPGGTLARLAEAGEPELVSPLSKAPRLLSELAARMPMPSLRMPAMPRYEMPQIQPRMMQPAGAGGRDTIININRDVYGWDDFADMIAAANLDTARRGGGQIRLNR